MLKEDSKFYWLKLYENFFDRDEIKLIESLPSGKEYIIFYLKLQLKSMNTGGKLLFSQTIPYNLSMLATITHTNVDIVKNALEVFIEFGLIEIIDNQVYYLREIERLIGKEASNANAQRQRRFKEKQKALPKALPKVTANVTKSNGGNVTKDNESIEYRDKSIEIRDKSIEIRDESVENTPNGVRSNKFEPIIEAWNSLGLVKIKSINGDRSKMLNARVNEYGQDNILLAIENIKQSGFLKGQNNRNWIIDFNWFIKPNNFIKVLEGNYIDRDFNSNNQSPHDFQSNLMKAADRVENRKNIITIDKDGTIF